MSAVPPVRAVVFDFYGTLTPGRSDAAQGRARRAQAEAMRVDPARFDAELTATVDERFRGAGGSVAGSLRWVTSRLGVDVAPPHLDRGADVRLAAERTFGEPRPEAAEVLRALQARGLRIGVVSDCSAELPAYFAELPIAPHVDAAVFSFVTGHRKPEPANYLACCDALGVAAAECVYVGDGGSDELAGARAVGMRAVHLDVADETGSVVYGRHLTWDGERVTALAEVLDLG
ncbi:putative hydrolase of the HAD superfamily [Jatrophihabitans endophyticus]|uniref:Putative hydrolase of the HAD superfamily n=1 Tax=Jatrophihabitans endophyticus TaxID=1206085 RepID=A0A1M5T2H5_9ACTN|nr:HAD family hydrolase [Jatrophihabitans endophyticus]SHH44878.1 putative hydrolase of the HAD superfamily [Jatrophihabitans endophyticus]